MTTGQLIDLLIKDLKPEWSFNRIVLLATGTGVLISASAFLVGVGFRADIARSDAFLAVSFEIRADRNRSR